MNLVCDKCSNGVVYEPESQNLVCKTCGNIVMIERDYQYTRRQFSMNGHIVEERVPKINMTVSIKCSTCGAINNGEKSMLHNCVYCGAKLRGMQTKIGANNIDGCLPFVVSDYNVRSAFKEQLKNKRFLPNDFKNLPENAIIEGLYYTAYKFNIDINAGYTADLIINENEEKVTRRIVGNKYFTRRDIVLEGSSYLSEFDFDSILPYDYSGLVKFDERFIAGFDIEASNRSLAEVRDIARMRATNNIESEIKKDYNDSAIENLRIKHNFMNCDYSKILLPVYKISYKYGNKEYMSFLNGQTGKIGGKLPKSGLKIFLAVMGAFVAIGGVLGLIIKAIN